MLSFADVKVELENDGAGIRQQLLERVNVIVAPAPDLLRHEFMHAHHQHILIMRAVKDFDISRRRRLRMHAPEEIVRQFFLRGDLK